MQFILIIIRTVFTVQTVHIVISVVLQKDYIYT